MSDLARSFARAKIASLPPEVPSFDETEEDQGDSSSASSISSTGTILPPPSQRPASTRPSAWPDFFQQELYLETNVEEGTAKYHVYVNEPTNSKAPVFVLHHGAGSTGMSFSLLAQQIKAAMPEAGILAVDARDHGSDVHDADGQPIKDLSIQALAEDLTRMIRLTADRLKWQSLPRLLLVGHSLGGAVVTHVAKSGDLGHNVLGYAVLDVVEGSALETIQSMSAYLSTRPTSFDSVDQAIDWHVRSRTLRNPASARASVPPLLIQTDNDRWKWRTDLSATEPFWQDWFNGMSKKFLEARGAKLLLLAGTDRLDKELMIGQMQGKFQLQVFPAAGHFVHEDLPEKTAETLIEFFKRNDSSSIKLPPKVSELLTQGKKV